MEWVFFDKFEQVGTRPQDVKDVARTDELVVASFLMPLMCMKGQLCKSKDMLIVRSMTQYSRHAIRNICILALKQRGEVVCT